MELESIKNIGFGNKMQSGRRLHMFDHILNAIGNPYQDPVDDQFGEADQAYIVLKVGDDVRLKKADLTRVVDGVFLELLEEAKAKILECGFEDEKALDDAIGWWIDRHNSLSRQSHESARKIESALVRWSNSRSFAGRTGFPEEIEYPYVVMFRRLNQRGIMQMSQYIETCRRRGDGRSLSELKEKLEKALAEEIKDWQ